MHESVMYMTRNLIIGDGEQTRIDNDQYWKDMPAEWQQLSKTLINADMYDEACAIWLKYHTQDVTEEELQKEADAFLEEWNSEEGIEDGNEEHSVDELVEVLTRIKYDTYFSD